MDADTGWKLFDTVRRDQRWAPHEFIAVTHDLLVPLVDHPKSAGISERMLRHDQGQALPEAGE